MNALTPAPDDPINPSASREVAARECGSHNTFWYVVHTRPGEEWRAKANLERLRFTVFFPEVVVRKPNKPAVQRPMFPNYGFIRFDAAVDPWGQAVCAWGVKNILRRSSGRERVVHGGRPAKDADFGIGAPWPVPAGFVEKIMAKCDADGILDDGPPPALPPLPVGEKARVTAGAFAGFEGICTWSSELRVKLLLDIMGGREVELPRSGAEGVSTQD